MTHPRLHAAFLRGVHWAEEEGVFVVQLGHFRGQIEVEDTPFWAIAYDPETGEVELTDRTREPLDPVSLTLDSDGVLRCRVKAGRFPARFTRSGQAHVLDALELVGDRYVLRVGQERVPLRALEVADLDDAP